MLCDIHTHLYWETYDEDRDVVIKRAKAAGVEKMFVVGCTLEESRQAVQLAEQYSEISASIGIHPHTFNELGIGNLTAWMEELGGLAKNKRVVAIGECGLDYYSHDSKKSITQSQREIQKKGFEAQLRLAEELKLPVIVHCRDAYEDTLEVLRTRSSQLKAAILHCYMGDSEITKKFLEIPNVYFSFTANITYPVKKSVAGTKNDLTETVRTVPLERLFTETDCPFLAPQEKRGERNEPVYVVAVAEKIAELHGTGMETVAKKTHSSIQAVFGITPV